MIVADLGSSFPTLAQLGWAPMVVRIDAARGSQNPNSPPGNSHMPNRRRTDPRAKGRCACRFDLCCGCGVLTRCRCSALELHFALVPAARTGLASAICAFGDRHRGYPVAGQDRNRSLVQGCVRNDSSGIRAMAEAGTEQAAEEVKSF